MAQIHIQASKLAYLADRKFLALPEENFYRLDISAHEKLILPWFLPKKRKSTVHVKSFAHFGLVSLTIFTLLFAMTNAQAYTKIILSDINAAQQAQINEMPIQHLALLSEEISSKDSKHLQQPNKLKALEKAAITPENGILPLNLWLTEPDDRISIPSLNIDVPLVKPQLGLDSLKSQDWNALEEQIRSSLQKGVVYYPGTAEPGTRGNFFVTGHSSNFFWELSKYNTVFALLPKIQNGADIYITYDQNRYHYKVSSKTEVKPDDVSILRQGNDFKMTLMTCTPVGTSLKRLVVGADLVN